MRIKISLIILCLFFSVNIFGATATSTGDGAWSAAIWTGGAGSGGAPADGDSVVIAAGHEVLMDADLSAWTGLLTVTIQGDDATPGTLYFKDGTSGHLKLRTGYNIVGDSGTNKGRLLANSDGVWDNNGSLAFANKAIIELTGTSIINAQYLDIKLLGTEPTNKYVRTYYDKYTVSSLNTSTNVITCGESHGWSENRAVSIRSSGTLPAPLLADVVYYVGSPSGAALKLLYTSRGTEVDLTSEGSGTIEIYSGYESYSGVSTVNVLEDITGDASWVTTDGHDHVILADSGTVDVDYQRLQLNDISTPYSIVLSAALDSTQFPGAKIFLISRNVSIRGGGTGGSQAIIDFSSATTSSGVFQCEVRNTQASGTTAYGNAINYGTNHTISGGTFAGNNHAINYGTNHTISGGTFAGNNHAIYYGTNHTISGGTFAGNGYAIFSGTNHTISGGTFAGNGYAINYGTNHTISGGTFAGNGYAIYSGINHTISGGTFAGNSYDFRGYQYNIKIREGFSVAPIFYSRNNTDGTVIRVKFENYLGVNGDSKTFDNFGDITKVAVNNGGDTPTQNPGGTTTGDVLEVISLSNCGALAIYDGLTIIEDQRIWLTAAEHTITYKVNTTYEGITAGNLKLTGTYMGTDGKLTEITHAPAILQRSSATDWTQELTLTFTPTQEGWANFKIELFEYESGNEVYVWPVPIVE